MTQRRSDNATWRRVQRKGVLCARARCLCSKLSRRSHPQPEQVHSARQRDVGWRPATSAATTLTWFTKSSDLPSIFLCPPSRPPKFLWIFFFVFFYQALPNPFCFCWAPLSSFFFFTSTGFELRPSVRWDNHRAKNTRAPSVRRLVFKLRDSPGQPPAARPGNPSA